MAKTKRKKTLQATLAAWMFDAFGEEGIDSASDFNWYAADLQRYMKAHGFDFHATQPRVERPPF